MLTWKNELVLVMGKLFAVLLSLWITSNVDGKSLAETTSPHSTDRVRACGVRLKHEIASICNLSSLRSNGYYIPGLPSIIEPRKASPEQGPDIRQHTDANNEIPTRTSRGVIEECCRKPCDRLQLLKYCATSEMKDKNATPGTTSPPSDYQSQIDDGQARLLPLLLQLLWDLDNMNKGSDLMKNYIPLKLPDALNRRQRPGNGRGISPRDIYKNQFSFLQPGSIPSSDETLRDKLGSVQINSEEPYQSPMVMNRASQVTDEPQPQVFPIPAGTNAEFFIL